MPVEYDCFCSNCGFEKRLNYGSFFSPFDSCGKMWGYRIYSCGHCGNLESRYLPIGREHRSYCSECNALMSSVVYLKDLKLRVCPKCSVETLKIKGKVVRHFSREVSVKILETALVAV